MIYALHETRYERVGQADGLVSKSRMVGDLMASEIIPGPFRDLGARVVTAEAGVDLTVYDEAPGSIHLRWRDTPASGRPRL